MDWLWISAIVLLVAGMIIFLPLLGRREGTSGRRKAESSSVPSDSASSEPTPRVDDRDRDEMLDGVRNLARDNPKKVASMVRHWMKE